MKQIFNGIVSLTAVSLLATACIKETYPAGSTITGNQMANAPGAFETAVTTVTSTMVGQFTYGGSAYQPWDFGYPSFFFQRDLFGQDIIAAITGNTWYFRWYAITSQSANTNTVQLTWTYYYKWISNCNIVLNLAGEEPTPNQRIGAGIAHASRAMYYMDLARMFFDKNAPERGTVPIITEKTTLAELSNNPRAPWAAMWEFILADLDKAETYLENFDRTDVTIPNLSVVYGLKARAYLTMENWAEAERYAKLAQEGYTPTTNAQYTDRMTAFNTPTDGWMLGVQYRASDPNITQNDSDSNWGSQMFLEVDVAALYANAYGSPFKIDRHLYETIPATDIRKVCYLDFSLDGMAPDERTATLTAKYTDYPHCIDRTVNASERKYGGLILKFRAAGGEAGRANQYLATAAAVPLMRVEEMMLIEAEAAGMQTESRGVALLTAFGQLRDPEYNYESADGSTFRDKVWWQRRVELFGEGFATFDIKRLNKGIIRSYANTNHHQGYRYNTTDVPQWMNVCIVTTEQQYNLAIDNNPNPERPSADSPEYVW